MALLRRELCRQIKGPEITHADFRPLVFDTDAKTLYVEREVAHVHVHDGMTEIKTTTMDICELPQARRPNSGHRELWRLLRTLFEKDINSNEVI
jgi:hypothetical protein